MDETFEGRHSRKSIHGLSESIRSLLGFKTSLTPSWVDSVCNIIKELPSGKSAVGSTIDILSPKFVRSKGKDTETSTDLSKIQDELTALNSHLNQLSKERKQALNDYLDLKGNIRVFCRIRPILPDEKCGPSRPVFALDSSNVLLKLTEDKTKRYIFDKVFHPWSSQDEVFSEVEPVIRSALDGYNACIFAYGQTGTGKTFTMEGRPDCPGVVLRAIEALFKQSLDTNHTFLFTFSMLEIYMGSLRDLLVPKATNRTHPITQCLPIKMDPDGGIEINNLVTIRVTEFNQAKRLYRLGSRLRSTASTNSNMTSSRSHCLIRITVTCVDAPERRRETNKVWMVDLGGSERLLKTKARGRRLEEGKAINLSLSALGDVISALQRKKPHVPYRNSKLTKILRDSLGEDSKTIMLVHVSPKEEDLCETVCSLGFATRVRSIQLGHEESAEVKAKKEAAMSALLDKVSHLENARKDVRRDIEKLCAQFKRLTKTDPLSNELLEYAHLSHEEIQPTIEQKKQNIRNVAKALSLRIPRFMRPTISSKQKSGAEHQSSEFERKKEPQCLKRRKSSSVQAGSVAGTIEQSQSECGSDVLGFTWKHGTGYETECSHGTSECDVKMVIFPEQEKSSKRSVCSISIGSNDSIHESDNSWADIIDPQKCLTVDEWLHLQQDQPTRTYIQQNKRVLAIPLPEKNNGDRCEPKSMIDREETFSNLRNKEDTIAMESNDGHFTEKELCNDDIIDQLDSGGDIESSPVSSSTDGVNVIDVGFTPTSTSDMMSKFPNQNKKYLHMVSKTEHIKDGQEPPFETAYETDLGNKTSAEIDQAAHKEAIISNGNIIIENSDHGDSHASPKQMEEDVKPWLPLMRCRRALFLDKDSATLETVRNSSAMSSLESQKRQQNAGICGSLGQKVQILYAGVLLGLGVQSIGLGHDFFHGLML